MGSVAFARKALFIFSSGIGRKEDATGLEASVQFRQHTRQLLAGHMKQAGIGKHSVKGLIGKAQVEKVLLPDLCATEFLRLLHKGRATVQTYHLMASSPQRQQVAPRATPKIKNAVRAWACECVQHCLDILLDIVVAGAEPERFRVRFVMTHGACRDFFQGRRVERMHAAESAEVHAPVNCGSERSQDRCEGRSGSVGPLSVLGALHLSGSKQHHRSTSAPEHRRRKDLTDPFHFGERSMNG